ncbi:MAG: hypothetical protein P8M50_04730 [Paracoccaceae bacterium]|nr:hypothetical protein [Paracoccaceae bacterium]
MEKNVSKFFRYFCFLTLLISCQNMQSVNENNEKSTLSSDNGQLDLSLSTLEQQNIEKAEAEKLLLEAKKKRTVVEPNQTDDLDQKSEVNIALYARQNLNAVGNKIFNRIQTKKNNSDPCLRFLSADDAQRFFLEKNGPDSDFWNLDPDGDGFACKWNPEQYRKLNTN